MSFNTFCSDACLQNAACYDAAWGNIVLPSLTKSFPTKAAALEWVEANPGTTMGLVSFESGVAGSADPTAEVIKYSLGTNTTVGWGRC